MAFDSLSEKLQNVFRNLRSKGRLTEDDVKAALKEVKLALLEADVNFKVVKQFTKSVQERAIGSDVMNGLNPGQMVIKIVNEEMVKLMGSETTELLLKPSNEITVLMMAGLQGAGKTKTCCTILVDIGNHNRLDICLCCHHDALSVSALVSDQAPVIVNPAFIHPWLGKTAQML